jgi:xanthine dehydrogenase accessory factor
MQNIFSKAEEIKNEQTPAALCIVVETSGSTPRKNGAKMIVYADGSIYGTIGGGSIEKDVVAKAVEQIIVGKPAKFVFNLAVDLGMHCGGSMEVYIEPINRSQKLYIFGAGHIGKALAGFAKVLEFSVTVFDSREDIFTGDEFENCTCINKDYFQAIDEVAFDENTYSVIVTPKHSFDEDVLERISRKPHAYIGMIGSTRKVDLLKKRFIAENILNAEELEKIDMPIGIKLKAESPHEIAISILAKLIDVRNSMKEE